MDWQQETMEQIGNSNLRFIKAKEGDRLEIFMINIIMTEEIIKICTDQIAETGEFNLVDKVEVEPGMNRIIAEEILELMWECIKILGDRIEEDIEEIIGMKIITEKEVGVGLEKDHFEGTLIIEEMTKA